MVKGKKKAHRGDLQRGGNLVPGFHAVREALIRGNPPVMNLWIAREKETDRIREVLKLAEAGGVPVTYRDRSALDAMFPDIPHQGIAAEAGAFSYTDKDEIIEAALREPGRGLILAADHITDEGNLGALIRAAAFFGVHGLILPKDRSARVTPRVMKRSSGACACLPVARVVNLGRALDYAEKKGFWLIGADGNGPETVYEVDWNRDVVLVLGREDRGLTRGVRERCHQVVRIPGHGVVESLNVSVAGGVILSEINRQRQARFSPRGDLQ
ncbi:MAG: 23S rRNA (guanosine(2251)-2'-O)-methyltransferase RlmB [Deltaproteobacteria bacterium]|nr:23S rRNA (guanosine(2251)-2'-O)-methyltransferase RlmB [Deltaproteobacteria bacterium]MBW2127973.1 23S rRNA (guanosine(2251)-2'-O)-methyltransferase RlmB [Deltaproteobacteria bacterium]